MRRTVSVPAGATNLAVTVIVDNDAHVYWNGASVGAATHEGCATVDEFTFAVPGSLVTSGANLLAVPGTDRGDQTFLDVKVQSGAGVAAGQTLGCTCNTLAVNPTGRTPTRSTPRRGTTQPAPPTWRFRGLGEAFAMSRTYNSADHATSGELGLGWTDPFQLAVGAESGRRLVVRGPDGQQLGFTHQPDGSYQPDGGGRATLSTVSGGGWRLVTRSQTRYAFNVAGKLTGVHDRNSKGLSLAYGIDGRLATVTDAAGRVVAFTHGDVAGYLTRVVLPDGRHVDYHFTGDLLTSVTDVRGGTVSYGYDADLNLASITSPRGNTTRTSYDQAGNLRTVDGPPPSSTHTAFTYDQFNDVTSFTDARGNTTSYDYDAAGNLTRATRPGGVVTAYGRDPAGTGLLASVTDPNNHTTTYGYDTAFNLARATSSKGEVAAYGYDASTSSPRITQLTTLFVAPGSGSGRPRRCRCGPRRSLSRQRRGASGRFRSEVRRSRPFRSLRSVRPRGAARLSPPSWSRRADRRQRIAARQPLLGFARGPRGAGPSPRRDPAGQPPLHEKPAAR